VNLETNKIDCICIAVKKLDEVHNVWEPVLGKTEIDDAYKE